MSSRGIKSLIVFAFTGIFTLTVSSQNQITDSLKNLLEKDPADTVKVYLLYKISDQYFNSTIHDTAMLYARQAYKLAEEIGYRKGQARSLTRIGNILEGTGDFPEALKALHSGLEISEQEKDLVGIGAAYNNIARVYTEQKTGDDFNKAIGYYRKAKSIFEQLEQNQNLCVALFNIGDNFEKMDQLDSAWVYQKQAHDMSVQNEDINFMGITLVNLGYIHFKKGQIDSAFKNFRSGIKYLIESDDKESLPDAWNSLSECFEKIGATDSSIFYAKRSLEMAQVGSNKQAQLDAANQLTSLYGSLKVFDSGFKYSRLATEIKGNIYDNEKAGEIQRMYAREQFRQQKLEEERIVTAEKREANLQIILITGFIITFFVVLVILSQKKINPRAIEILGVLGLLLVFEFITIFIHPLIGDLTHHKPIYMLVILVLIAALLGPLHHYLTKWLKKKLVRHNPPENKTQHHEPVSSHSKKVTQEKHSTAHVHNAEHDHTKPIKHIDKKTEETKSAGETANEIHEAKTPHLRVTKKTDLPSGEDKE